MGRYTKTSVEASESYPCTVSSCSYIAVKKSYLQLHLNRVHFGKLHKCGSCNYETRIIYNMKYHQVLHSGKKPETCHVCKKKFTHTAALRVHIGRKHSELLADHNMLSCNQCNFRTVIPSLLRQHMFKHRCEQSDHYCATCDKYFVFSCNLEVHYQSKRHLRKSQPKDPPFETTAAEEPQIKIPPCISEPVSIQAMQHVSEFIKKRQTKLQRRLRKNKPLNGTTFKCRFCPWTTDDFWDFLRHLRKLTILR